MSDATPLHRLFAIFNPANRKFIGFSFSPAITQGKLLVKEITTVEPINISTAKWEGDYETGSLVNSQIGDKTDVYESVLLEQKYEVLFRQYPIHTILDNILSQFNRLIENEKISPRDVLPQMHDLLTLHKRVETKFIKDLAFFSQSPDHNLVTITQQEQNMNQAFES